MVKKGLITIDNDLILANRKESDEGLNGLIKDYREISDKHSSYEDLSEDITGIEFKQLINQLDFKDRVKLVYR